MTCHLLGYTVLLLLWASCTAQNADCESPPRRDYEQLSSQSDKEVYSHDEKVIYICRPGYIKLGRITYQCNNGSWEKVPPFTECRKKPCGHPGDTQFGSFELLKEEEFVFGARVVYHCDDGYQMISQTDYRDCRADGWSNDVPHCEVKKCFPVTAPENGRIIMTGIQNLDQEYLFGQVVRFECTGTFRINGSDQIICTNKGEWSAPVPTCIEITCRPGLIEHGFLISPNRVYKENEVLQFTCNPGYKHFERSDARCTQNGWYPRPACTEIVCSPPEVGNGRFTPRQNQYRNDDEVRIQCNSGYRLDHPGDISKCTERGWSPPPQCIKKPCDVPIIKNGRLTDSYQYTGYFPRKVGQTVDYQCNDGFLPINKYYYHRSTCREFGWDPEPKCFKQCIPPGSFPYGRLIYSSRDKFIEENEISYSCDEGYYPASPGAKAKCTKDGWASTLRCAKKVTCKAIHPQNGYFQQHNRDFALHETATYGCQSGYTTPKGLDRGETQCLEEGWTPKPECIQTCRKPPERNMIFINATKSVFLFMEKLVFQCHDGYETSNSTTGEHTVCTEKGWDPKPDCQRIRCDVPTLEHGRIQPRKDQYFEGDVVRFSCLGGRFRVGIASSQCYYFGWSPPPPVCKDRVDPCSAPPGISDGRITHPLLEVYSHGTKVEYECNDRFAMVGSSQVECVDGEWTTLPSCTEEEKTCGPPPNITYGHPVSEDGYKYFHGDTMSYKCEENTFSIGPNPAKCLHGKWELPSCVDDRTNCAPPKLPNSLPSGPQSQYKTNSTVSYSCGSDRHITKCVKGKWSPEPQCKGHCPPPPQLPNAIIRVINIGSVKKIRFKCKEHFKLQGPQEIACENGKWQRPPHCLDLRCEDPPAIENGDVKENRTEGKYPPGSPVEYQCHDGFEISGKRSVTCSNKKWSPPPTCNEKPCRNPPTVFDSSVVERVKTIYQAGETVTYTCHTGFGADGPLTVTCRRGEWTEPPVCEDKTCQELPSVDNAEVLTDARAPYLPGHQVQYQCYEGFEMSGSDTIICENKTWSKPPVCKDATCASPPAVSHGHLDGQLKERYLPFEKVRYRCDQGWSLFGPQSVTCSNKKWSELPQCREAGGRCDRPPVIENGDIPEAILPPYESNSVVRYKCQSFYIMDGRPDVRCVNGHWTEAPRCIAPCTASEEEMKSRNIQLKWLRKDKLYSQSGDVMEFCCRRGFQPAPSSPPFRVQCIEGRLEYPSCIKFCTLNEQMMRNRRIVLKQTLPTRMGIPSGDYVEFTCSPGYRAASTSSSFRVQCSEGNLEYPRCTCYKRLQESGGPSHTPHGHHFKYHLKYLNSVTLF
ncbi:complement factor H [Tiliqua scincoides]|uniref:complement factor H n=1 Tax=Tiliqua scincoides TaxID=71010 RepID=UPI003461F998